MIGMLPWVDVSLAQTFPFDGNAHRRPAGSRGHGRRDRILLPGLFGVRLVMGSEVE
jgi:hypothetical protein